MKRFALFLLILASFAACRSSRTKGTSNLRLHFLSEYILPDSTVFRGTRVGGLSGIDYDSASDAYFLVSDDRSDYNAARFYTAKILIGGDHIGQVRFTGVDFLKQKSGALFPNKKQDSLHVPDPEAIRMNRSTGDLVWSNEGERIVRATDKILQDPSVTVMKKDGAFVREYDLPQNLRMSAEEKGPRRNGVFEGLAFSPDFQNLYVSVEEPLYEDGPRAGIGDSSAWVRILRYDANTLQPVAQYAYRLDPVVKRPTTPGGFVVNGVVDLLALDQHRLLVTERSFSTGFLGCNVRLYLVDLRDADDISQTPSLLTAPPKRFLRKTLLLNLDNLGREVYNIEGATFGPRLANGHRSLLLVSDDNFSGREKTQFLLFDLEETTR